MLRALIAFTSPVAAVARVSPPWTVYKAVAGKPTVDMSIGAGAVGRPEGPPAMPGDLLMEPAVSIKRMTAVTGLAASPWAPVLAVAGQKQIVLYNSDTLDLLGVLPFKDEQGIYQPDDVKFSFEVIK